jgi:hypothetical protein
MEVMPNGLERLDSNETISFGDVAGAENYPRFDWQSTEQSGSISPTYCLRKYSYCGCKII